MNPLEQIYIYIPERSPHYKCLSCIEEEGYYDFPSKDYKALNTKLCSNHPAQKTSLKAHCASIATPKKRLLNTVIGQCDRCFGSGSEESLHQRRGVVEKRLA